MEPIRIIVKEIVHYSRAFSTVHIEGPFMSHIPIVGSTWTVVCERMWPMLRLDLAPANYLLEYRGRRAGVIFAREIQIRAIIQSWENTESGDLQVVFVETAAN